MVKILEAVDKANELIAKGGEFEAVGLRVEGIGDMWPHLEKSAKQFPVDELYWREDGDEPYPKSIPKKLAKDYAIDSLNRVFGERRFSLQEETKDLLLGLAIDLATIAIKEEIERTID